MRWDELFADLEGQLVHALDREAVGLDLEEERLRLARLGLRERLAALAADRRPAELALLLLGGQSVHLRLDSVGRDWLAGAVTSAVGERSTVVPLWSIVAITPARDRLLDSLAEGSTEAVPTDLSARLGFAFVLRELCRRRAPVEVDTLGGSLSGTIDRVARDHLDLAEHEPGVPRRESAVRRVRLLAFPAILAVRAAVRS